MRLTDPNEPEITVQKYAALIPMSEDMLIDNEVLITHRYVQDPHTTVRVCTCGYWPDHHVHTGDRSYCTCDGCQAYRSCPIPTRWTELRWDLSQKVASIRLRLGSWVAGVDLEDRELD